MKILLADDSKTNQMLISAYAEDAGHQVVAVSDGQQAIDSFKNDRPDLVIMDVNMPVKDGIEATKEIRELTKSDNDWVPIIFLSGMSESDDIARGIDAGGDDYLGKPIDGVVLAAKLRAMGRISDMRHELSKLNRELKMISIKDGLTGIANRRHFDEIMKKELKRSVRTKTELSLVLCDIDQFKLYNDSYGHQGGDDCLKSVAVAFAKVSNRPGDLAARYGGEEFAVILPETGSEGAKTVAETICKSIEALEIPHKVSTVSEYVTLSCGVASIKPGVNMDLETTIRELIEAADRNLYKAKEAGRNQVIC